MQQRGQLSLFDSLSCGDRTASEESPVRITQKKPASWQLFIDGAARRNPGPAGAGIYIVKDGMPFFQEGYYLGEQTNNQAEYDALLLGLCHIEHWKQPQDTLSIFSDSQLLVRQIKGIYRVRNTELIPKHKIAVHWVTTLGASIDHVPREENSHADAMANKGIDLKKAVPAKFNQRLRLYEVTPF